MTLLILDNGTVAMTGCQPTLLPSARLRKLVLGLGVEPAHMPGDQPVAAAPRENAQVIREEMEHRGVSVIVALRDCVELPGAAPRGKRMKYDLVLAGVGGQGVLSVAAIIAEAARCRRGCRCGRPRCTAWPSGAGRCRPTCAWPTGPSPATWWPGARRT